MRLKMNPAISLRCICFYVLLFCATSSGVDERQRDREYLESVVTLVEGDYKEQCSERAAAIWKELIGSPEGLKLRLDADKKIVTDVENREYIKLAHKEHLLGESDDILKRKVQLLLQPGDLQLGTDQGIRLVTFADTALHKIRFSSDYDCGSRPCSLRDFHNNLAKQQDEVMLKRMKESWEKNLPDFDYYFEQILPLLRNASKDYGRLEDYWNSLVEYEGAIIKARELWEGVKSLYVKLHKYVALRLLGDKAVGENLPIHLLRSLNGDDWSNVIDNLLPKHPAVYQKVSANLEIKNLGGETGLKAAAELIKELNLGEMKSDVWKQSVFNTSCPPVIVDSCEPNKPSKVATCKDVSIGNYLDAHETAMKIAYKNATATYSRNTYILREAPRYSAIYEAIPGFISLLALSPHALSKNGLFDLDVFNLNANHHRMILQLILALRDLPKLNFYLAADEWRLKVLSGSGENTASSWSDFRKEFSQLETSNVDLLGDPYVLFNKPFIGKFMGLILKYQIYQSYAEELMSDESDLIKHVAENSERLKDVMIQGYSVKWPELVSDLLAKKENGLEYTGLTDYYQLLEEYFDIQFDPIFNTIEAIDDYLDPAELNKQSDRDESYDFDANFDDNKAVIEDVPKLPIETGLDDDKHDHNGAETTTEWRYVELSLQDSKTKKDSKDTKNEESEKDKEKSYNMYWWIGIAVALAIVVILIAIIARKRHNHRKQLEKQRRENSRA